MYLLYLSYTRFLFVWSTTFANSFLLPFCGPITAVSFLELLPKFYYRIDIWSILYLLNTICNICSSNLSASNPFSVLSSLKCTSLDVVNSLNRHYLDFTVQVLFWLCDTALSKVHDMPLWRTLWYGLFWTLRYNSYRLCYIITSKDFTT